MSFRRYMNQSKFAALCDVSGAMISKYAVAGRLKFNGRKVDAAESLKALEGHLDEDKRRAAVKRLVEIDAKAPPALFDVFAGDLKNEEPGVGDPMQPVGWKARREMYQAKEAELSYHERVGLLIDASEVGAAIESVVAIFWNEAERLVKMDAAEISSELKLDANQASQLRIILLRNNRRLRENFSQSCQKASQVSGPTHATQGAQ